MTDSRVPGDKVRNGADEVGRPLGNGSVVHGSLASQLLDRFVLHREDDDIQDDWVEEDRGERRSILIFRVGDAWLGLATRALSEVAVHSPIHSLPHQRSLGLMGVTNVRGALVACVSLAEMLGLDGASASTDERVVPRMLILACIDGPVVMPVDEVQGIEIIALRQVVEVGNGSVPVARRFASGVLQWQGRSVTLLDEGVVQQTIARSLG